MAATVCAEAEEETVEEVEEEREEGTLAEGEEEMESMPGEAAGLTATTPTGIR